VSRKLSGGRPAAATDWPADIHRTLKSQGVRQLSYVPDAGHKRLIELCHADRSLIVVPLTTEEEGIGLAAGAWLGGQRSALLMQSSGVGNCINSLTLATNCGIPLLMLVAMRGERGESNPWQIPMGQAAQQVLASSGVRTLRLEKAAAAGTTVATAGRLAFDGFAAVAVLISQSLIGFKSFEDKG
jgi:sulfopyruvate decarboxylase alpha subunit